MPDTTGRSITITTLSIIKVIVAVLAVYFLWTVRDIAALLFVCLILSSAFDPTVDFLAKYRIPRGIAIILIYIVFIAALSLIIFALAGPIVTEVRGFAQDLPRYYDEFNTSISRFRETSISQSSQFSSLRGNLDSLVQNLTHVASGNILPAIRSIFGGVVSLILAMVITFYFTVYENAVRQFIFWISPRNREKQISEIIEKIQTRLGYWLRGQLTLSLIIFILVYIGLKILGVKYALVLAILAGFFEVVPYLGPIIGAIPAVLLTMISPWGGLLKATFVVVLYILIQQAENNFIVPKVMSKSVGLNPLAVIIAILVGAKMGGLVGMFVAVPVAAAIAVFLEERGAQRDLVE